MPAIYHIDSGILKEVRKIVGPDECSCGIEPLYDEYVAIVVHA